jgi:CBS domain containing-hemolysin-like protein
VEIHASLEEARATILKAGHSRLPVYEGSLDHVLGLLYAKDLLSIWHRGETSTDLRSLLRPPMFVPESKRVPDLLNELQTAKVHMAVVIDEYGGTAGLVTLEDIVEEIVGEILDEYDAGEEALYETVSPMEFIFDARIDLDDFNEMMDANLPDEESDTLGGFIYAELGKVPEAGELVQTPTLQLEVLGVEDRRIRKVRVTRVVREEPSAPGQSGKDQVTNGSSNGH